MKEHEQKTLKKLQIYILETNKMQCLPMATKNSYVCLTSSTYTIHIFVEMKDKGHNKLFDDQLMCYYFFCLMLAWQMVDLVLLFVVLFLYYKI